MPHYWTPSTVMLLHLFNSHLVKITLCLDCRGIPGKKCGTIILSAEELGNCRVRVPVCFLFANVAKDMVDDICVC